MDIQNVKFHLKIKADYLSFFQEQLRKSGKKTKTLSTFCVLRIHKFVYICFYNGCVNITGVRNLAGQETAIAFFAFELKLNKEKFGLPKVDNITAKYRLFERHKVNLHKFCLSGRGNEKVISTKYNRERFPCAYFKTKFGTIIWSSMNAVACVGMKTDSDLKEIETIINQIYGK